MTWAEFGWNAAANAAGSSVGVFFGIPFALWIDRVRQLAADQAAASLRAEALRVEEEERETDRHSMIDLLIRSLAAKLRSVETVDNDIAPGRHVFTSGVELEAWDVLKPQLTRLIGDQFLAVKTALLFAELKDF